MIAKGRQRWLWVLALLVFGCDPNPNGPSAPSAPNPRGGESPAEKAPEKGQPETTPLRKVGPPIGLSIPTPFVVRASRPA
jgi:hypothetical protein